MSQTSFSYRIDAEHYNQSLDMTVYYDNTLSWNNNGELVLILYSATFSKAGGYNSTVGTSYIDDVWCNLYPKIGTTDISLGLPASQDDYTLRNSNDIFTFGSRNAMYLYQDDGGDSFSYTSSDTSVSGGSPPSTNTWVHYMRRTVPIQMPQNFITGGDISLNFEIYYNQHSLGSYKATTISKSLSYPKKPYPSATTTQVTTSNNIIYASNQTINKEFYGLWDRVNTICSYHGISGLGNFTTPTQYTTEITLTNYGAVLNKIKDLLNNTDFTIPSSATEAYAAANRIKNITYSANTSIIPQLSDYCTVINYWTSNNI